MATITKTEPKTSYQYRIDVDYEEGERPEVESYRHIRHAQQCVVERASITVGWNANLERWQTRVYLEGRYRLKSGKLGELSKIEDGKPYNGRAHDYAPDLSVHQLIADLRSKHTPQTVVVVSEEPAL